MGVALDFGVQSFCFRNIDDNAEVAQKVLEIGVDKIEVCRKHADFGDPETWKGIVRTYEDAGVSVVSIGVEAFTAVPTFESGFLVRPSWRACCQ